jgi:hypothetical protein
MGNYVDVRLATCGIVCNAIFGCLELDDFSASDFF